MITTMIMVMVKAIDGYCDDMVMMMMMVIVMMVMQVNSLVPSS